MMQKLAVLVLTGLGAVAAFGTLAPETAHAQQMSREVGVPLQDAKKAMEKRQWDAALAQLKKAQGVAGKKPHEEYVINEMLLYVQTQRKDYADAIRAAEANLASGRASPADVAAKQKMIAQMYIATRNWPKAIQYGTQWVKSSPGESLAHEQLAQAYYQAGQYKNSGRTIQQAIDVSAKAGRKPDQNWLVLKLDSQHKLNDEEGMASTREQLVRYYPSKDNWKAVLVNVYKVSQQPNNDERATMNLYRLMVELDVLEDADKYREMAEMAIDSGTPAEAVGVMEKAFANNTVPDKEKVRYQRLLDNAKTRAQAARAEIPKLDQAAKAASTGDADVQLGARYLSNGEYQKAIDSIKRGLQKGSVKGSDEAQMMLGRAHLKLKQKEQARKAFGAVPDDSKLAQVAQLWSVYAAQS